MLDAQFSNTNGSKKHHAALIKGVFRTHSSILQVGIYLFKVKNRNTRTRFEICSKLKTPDDTLNIFHTFF